MSYVQFVTYVSGPERRNWRTATDEDEYYVYAVAL